MSVEAFNPPLIVHHMGALDGSGNPPNSLEAIRASLVANADFIEIDANALAASDYLVMHGPDMSDETASTGIPMDYSVEAAQSVVFKRTSVRVPLLSEVVQLFQEYPSKTQLQIDYKNVLPFNDDEPLHRLIKLIEPLGKRVIVSTGSDWHLRTLKKLAPALRLGFDIHFYIDWRSADYVPNADPMQNAPPYRQSAYPGYWDDHFLGGASFWPLKNYLNDRMEAIAAQVPGTEIAYLDYHFILHALADGSNPVAILHEAGIRCDAWTLDIRSQRNVEALKTLKAAGVDQFTSNTPIALRQTLSEL